MLISIALSLVQLLAVSFHMDKTPQGTPSPISNAISKLVALAAADPQFVKPDSLTSVLTDLMSALEAANIVLPPDVAIKLEPVQKIIDSTSANIANIVSGQPAIVGDYTESANGVSFKVDIFALRQDSKTNVATDLGL